MSRDNAVTVTRTSRVTASVTSGVTQRVSHATTTTPHHTMSLVAVVCGVSDFSCIASDRHLGTRPDPRRSSAARRRRPSCNAERGTR